MNFKITENISYPDQKEQYFVPIGFPEANLYYHSIINKNPNYNNEANNFHINDNHNESILKIKTSSSEKLPKNKSNENKSNEISLVALLNAIGDYNAKKSSPTPIKEIKIKNDSVSSESEKQQDSINVMELLTQKTKRNQKFCYDCPHHNSPHYAKGMCSNCYHSKGRKKKPWKCPHTNKFHYAHGLCQNCYQIRYMKKQNFGDSKLTQQNSNNDIEELTINSDNENSKKGLDIKKKKSKSRASKKKVKLNF